MSARISGFVEANVTFSKSPMATKTPIVMPRRAISFATRSCSSTDRPGMPLSSQAVKPWSAPNFSWSTRSFPACCSNMPKWGAYLRRKRETPGAASAPCPETATAAPVARVVFRRSRRFMRASVRPDSMPGHGVPNRRPRSRMIRRGAAAGRRSGGASDEAHRHSAGGRARGRVRGGSAGLSRRSGRARCGCRWCPTAWTGATRSALPPASARRSRATGTRSPARPCATPAGRR